MICWNDTSESTGTAWKQLKAVSEMPWATTLHDREYRGDGMHWKEEDGRLSTPPSVDQPFSTQGGSACAAAEDLHAGVAGWKG